MSDAETRAAEIVKDPTNLRVIAARQRVKERRQDGVMSEITPFKFEMGNWAGEGNLIAVTGTVEWGDGGWLVLSDDLRYQAPDDLSKTEAVLNWLRIRTGVDPLDNDGTSDED